MVDDILRKALNNVNIDAVTGCHIYMGDVDPGTGYGRIMVNGVRYLMHRVSCYIHHGLNLNNSELFACHKCNNRACINPEHLYVGTNKQNQLDAVNNHCPKGHYLSASNTMKRRRPNGAYYRNCKICHLARNRKSREKNRKER